MLYYIIMISFKNDISVLWCRYDHFYSMSYCLYKLNCISQNSIILTRNLVYIFTSFLGKNRLHDYSSIAFIRDVCAVCYVYEYMCVYFKIKLWIRDNGGFVLNLKYKSIFFEVNWYENYWEECYKYVLIVILFLIF